MVVAAEQDQVLEACAAPVDDPDDVVCVEVACLGAAGECAPAIAFAERPTLGARGGSFLGAQPEGHAAVVHQDLQGGVAQDRGDRPIGEHGAADHVTPFTEPHRGGDRRVHREAEDAGEDVDVDRHLDGESLAGRRRVARGVDRVEHRFSHAPPHLRHRQPGRHVAAGLRPQRGRGRRAGLALAGRPGGASCLVEQRARGRSETEATPVHPVLVERCRPELLCHLGGRATPGGFVVRHRGSVRRRCESGIVAQDPRCL